MNAQQMQIREKRNILRELYGGAMTAKDLASETGMEPMKAKAWGIEMGIAFTNHAGGRVYFDTDEFAKIAVKRRGFV